MCSIFSIKHLTVLSTLIVLHGLACPLTAERWDPIGRVRIKKLSAAFLSQGRVSLTDISIDSDSTSNHMYELWLSSGPVQWSSLVIVDSRCFPFFKNFNCLTWQNWLSYACSSEYLRYSEFQVGCHEGSLRLK